MGANFSSIRLTIETWVEIFFILAVHFPNAKFYQPVISYFVSNFHQIVIYLHLFFHLGVLSNTHTL